MGTQILLTTMEEENVWAALKGLRLGSFTYLTKNP